MDCGALESGKPFSDKKKWSAKPWKTQRKLKCLFLRQRSQSEEATSYMIPILWHSGKVKTMETVGSVVAGGWQNEQSMENFQGSETTLYDTVMVDVCPNPQSAQRSDPNVHCGLYLLMCQHSLIPSDKHTAGGQNGKRGTWWCVGNLCTFCSVFCKPQLL